MAGARQPTNLLLAKGNKHFTQQEIENRINGEVRPLIDNIQAPDYLSKKQKQEFNEISEQLQALEIMSETDVDALARYIISRGLYVKLSKQLRKKEILNDPDNLDRYLKNQDRIFKQCRASAMDLGLTITSRCRLCIPKSKDNEKPPNKFSAFEKGNIQ